jgi:hypothetical protein
MSRNLADNQQPHYARDCRPRQTETVTAQTGTAAALPLDLPLNLILETALRRHLLCENI